MPELSQDILHKLLYGSVHNVHNGSELPVGAQASKCDIARVRSAART
jgi:hypothetical protein